LWQRLIGQFETTTGLREEIRAGGCDAGASVAPAGCSRVPSARGSIEPRSALVEQADLAAQN
jgi:hypothetical protein